MTTGIPTPECLGKIAESYGGHCSEACHLTALTALCVLMSMGEYLSQNNKVPPSQDLSEN
jgi:hypothetical protein